MQTSNSDMYVELNALVAVNGAISYKRRKYRA